ncbi:MAG: hypothetical protein HFJ36_01210, partial [Clostridia bacterium]|nr:hypothetical protein [Clostridia bacterium]
INELKENLKQTEGVTGADSITSLPAKVTVDGYEVNIDESGKVIVKGDTPTPPVNNVAVPGEIVTGDENKTYTKNGTAVIPVGFAIVPGLDDISEGLVISDIANDTANQGNQFVWIPVADETAYERNKTYVDTNASMTAYDDTGYLPVGITNEEQQVRSAKGFYISRYEAGKEGTNTLVSKKGANIWIEISQENAKITAKTMFTKNTHVKSALISGIQWDMVMKFISSKPRTDGTNNPYDVTVFDSRRHIGNTVVEAGNNEADKVCNIYDLEGNAWEYIAEKNTYYTGVPFVPRSGSYTEFHTRPVSERFLSNGSAYGDGSFRLMLYVI